MRELVNARMRALPAPAPSPAHPRPRAHTKSSGFMRELVNTRYFALHSEWAGE